METIQRHYKKIIFALIDVVLINLSYVLALEFRFNFKVSYGDLFIYENSILVISLVFILSFYMFRLYDNTWKYASVDEFIYVIGACILGNVLSTLISMLFGTRLPYTVSALAGVFSIILISSFRMSFRINKHLSNFITKNGDLRVTNIMIIGAGSCGTKILNEIKRDVNSKYNPICFIDDDKSKIGTKICGIKVEGGKNSILSLVKTKKINTLLLAMPSVDKVIKKEIIDICKESKTTLKIIPSMSEVINGNVSLSQMRDVDVEDLLGRDSIKLDMDGIGSYLKDKTVLVTGGGGSIGSELCRQIATFKPSQLIILDIYENNAYDLQIELKYKFPKLNLKVLIASVRDKHRLDFIFKTYAPQVIFHAAAHKHVPLMEDSPMEAIKNNVFGTYNVAKCAHENKSQRFVLISTDKAVNPTNIMGASKRMCEMVIQAFDSKSETEYVAVRFGNVLGSNGSVIPLFKKQISQGGPVTVTNKYITRFFMTIPEAAQLVLQSGAYASGGEIFILDMGKPVKIYDLAYDLIKLSGFEPNVDISIEISGLRPGEKLYEELLMEEEGLTKTKHEKIFIGKPMGFELLELEKAFEVFKKIIEKNDLKAFMEKVREIVPTYHEAEADTEINTVINDNEVAATVETPLNGLSLNKGKR